MAPNTQPKQNYFHCVPPKQQRIRQKTELSGSGSHHKRRRRAEIKYLGIKLDKTMTFKQHLEGVKDKLKTRNNIIGKLAGTSWGCWALNVLRTSVLALVYSAAEYCAPVWVRSAHTKKVDVELNSTMRIISGCVRSTKVQWLPVLSNIVPTEIRRYAATVKLLQQI